MRSRHTQIGCLLVLLLTGPVWSVLPPNWDRVDDWQWTVVDDATAWGDTLAVIYSNTKIYFLDVNTGELLDQWLLDGSIPHSYDDGDYTASRLLPDGQVTMAATDLLSGTIDALVRDLRTGEDLLSQTLAWNFVFVPAAIASRPDVGIYFIYYEKQEQSGVTLRYYRLCRIAPDGSWAFFADLGDTFGGLARVSLDLLPDGSVLNLWDGSDLVKYSPDGETQPIPTPDYVDDLESVPDGSIVLIGHDADLTNYRVARIEQDGLLLWEVPTDAALYAMDLNEALGRISYVGRQDGRLVLGEVSLDGDLLWEEMTDIHAFKVRTLDATPNQGLLIGGDYFGIRKPYLVHVPRIELELSTPAEPWYLPSGGGEVPLTLTLTTGAVPEQVATLRLLLEPEGVASDSLLAEQTVPLLPDWTREIETSVTLPASLPNGAYTLRAELASDDSLFVLDDAASLIKLNTAAPDPTEPSTLPTRLAVDPPVPNPANARATLTVELPQPGSLAITVVDMTGRVVDRLTPGWRTAGRHRISLDLDGWASGTYLLRVHQPGHGTASTRLTVLK